MSIATPKLEAFRGDPSVQHPLRVSLVIPAFNEEAGLKGLLEGIGQVDGIHFQEILVIDDGSADGTAEVAASFPRVTVMRNPYNQGNGAAVKKGIRQATGDIVVILDADGQHPPSAIAELLQHVQEFDLVVGARTSSRSPGVRNIGNTLLNRFASFLSEVPIPDLTSGFRAGHRERLAEFLHLYPNGFSLPSTSTLAFLSSGYSVKFVPIENDCRRSGKSKIRVFRDALRFVVIIMRIVSMFYPLKVFVPACGASLLMGVLWTLRTLGLTGQVSALGAMFVIVGVFLFLFGLLADQVASIRLELGRVTRTSRQEHTDRSPKT